MHTCYVRYTSRGKRSGKDRRNKNSQAVWAAALNDRIAGRKASGQAPLVQGQEYDLLGGAALSEGAFF